MRGPLREIYGLVCVHTVLLSSSGRDNRRNFLANFLNDSNSTDKVFFNEYQVLRKGSWPEGVWESEVGG